MYPHLTATRQDDDMIYGKCYNFSLKNYPFLEGLHFFFKLY